jgi:hypothetical protein
VARWRHRPDPFPGPLQEFHEADWPPVEGECLEYYACHGAGYGGLCVPRPGEFCGQLHYESLARDFPDRPELLTAAKSADACQRFNQARLSWLGEDHPQHFTEMIDGWGRYAQIRGWARG